MPGIFDDFGEESNFINDFFKLIGKIFLFFRPKFLFKILSEKGGNNILDDNII